MLDWLASVIALKVPRSTCIFELLYFLVCESGSDFCRVHVGLGDFCLSGKAEQEKLESSSHTEHGQSVYLALCSVGTPSSRLFHGPPYLSLALLLLPPPPPVRMLSLGSLQAQNHTYITSYTWMSTPQSCRRLLTPLLSYGKEKKKTIAVSDSG